MKKYTKEEQLYHPQVVRSHSISETYFVLLLAGKVSNEGYSLVIYLDIVLTAVLPE